jgi:cold shock protein
VDPLRVVQAEDGHDGRADPDFVARDEGKQRYEKGVNETSEGAGGTLPGKRVGVRTDDTLRSQGNDHEEQAEKSARGHRRGLEVAQVVARDHVGLLNVRFRRGQVEWPARRDLRDGDTGADGAGASQRAYVQIVSPSPWQDLIAGSPVGRRGNLGAQPVRGRQNRIMAVKQPRGQSGDGRVDGVVRAFDAEEGWGVIEAPEVPGGCFVHFSNIAIDGYRSLDVGQHVRFTYEDPGFLQDGCPYRALTVWPQA